MHSTRGLTPVAGRIFQTKNRAIFLEMFFGRGISGEALLVYNFVPINWLWSGFISPRIRTFVEKRFHGLFSKKKRSKSGGVPSFPRREHVLAENSPPSGQRSALNPFHEITWLLKIERHLLPEKAVLGKNSSPEKSLQKNRSIFGLKNPSCYRRKTFICRHSTCSIARRKHFSHSYFGCHLNDNLPVCPLYSVLNLGGRAGGLAFAAQKSWFWW